ALTFLFSSRRRHTRFSRDWSSDVCSSDLPRLAPVLPGRGGLGGDHRGRRDRRGSGGGDERLAGLEPSLGGDRHGGRPLKWVAGEIGRASCRESGEGAGGGGAWRGAGREDG